MSDRNADYHRRRAEEEQLRAIGATCPNSAEAHRQLAEKHELLAQRAESGTALSVVGQPSVARA